MMTKLMERTIREVREVLMMDKNTAEKKYNINVERVDEYKNNRAIAILDAMQFFLDSEKENTTVEDKE
jgi:hypothetical protein